MKVIDHTDPAWRARYVRTGRENGAATYSRDIVKHHLPLWERVAPDVISTCPPMRSQSGRLGVQYLHEYPYADPIGTAQQVAARNQFDRLIFVTAYKAQQTELAQAGLEAIHVPMTIDARTVASHTSTEPPIDGGIYFGNITRPKREPFRQLQAAATGRLDVVSHSQFNGIPITQQQTWELASRYRFGVAVGRCALELMALGLPVLIHGAAHGGIITTPTEYQAQSDTNLNGRVTTHSDDIAQCLADIGAALTGRTNDIPVALTALEHAFDTAF